MPTPATFPESAYALSAKNDKGGHTPPNFLVPSDESEFRHAQMMARVGWSSDVPQKELQRVLHEIYSAKHRR